MRTLTLLSVTTLLALPLFAHSYQAEQDRRSLELATPIERELAKGEVHSYRIVVPAGQYCHVIVDQRGIDVLVTVLSPNGVVLAEADSPNGTQGPEPVAFVAEVGGNYVLQVKAVVQEGFNTPSSGRYNVTLDVLRPAVPNDKIQIAAARILSEAAALLGQNTPEAVPEGIHKYEEALPLFRQIGDRLGEATTLTDSGGLYQILGNFQKALDHHLQALPLYRAIGNKAREAAALTNIGDDYWILSDYQRSLDHHGQALALYRSLGDGRGEAMALSDICRVHDALSDTDKALDYCTRSLALSRATGNRDVEVTVLGNVAGVYLSRGVLQTALDCYLEQLQLSRVIGDRDEEAAALGNIGLVYRYLGELQTALDYYNQSLALERDSVGKATHLNNIGGVYSALGEQQKALDYFAQALQLRRAAGDRAGEANTLSNIGAVYNDLGEQQKSLDYHLLALPLRRAIGDRSGEAHTLRNMGNVYTALGEWPTAADHYTQALALERALGDRLGEVMTLGKSARGARASGDIPLALARIREAMNVSDSVRTSVGSQALRASYLATVRDNQDFYVGLLMQLHRQTPTANYAAQALQVVERGRSRSLLETLAEARADIRQGVDAVLLERERTLQRQLNASAQRQSLLWGRAYTPEEAVAAAKDLELLSSQLQQTEAVIRLTNPRYSDLTQLREIDFKEIQRLLDDDTMLLEYALGEEASYLWAVTSTSMTSYELAKGPVIETAARRFYESLNTPTLIYPRTGRKITTPDQQEMLQTASELSRMLLQPIASLLGKRRLVVVADGALQYVPFAALPDPHTLATASDAAQPMIVAHEVVSLPSMAVLATLRRDLAGRAVAPQTLAVLADPVFSAEDVRVKRPSVTRTALAPSLEMRSVADQVRRSASDTGARRDGDRLMRLPGTRREAEGLLALLSAAKSRSAFDFDASRQFATSGELSRYRYVHFATHGLLNSVHPELSALVLSLVDTEGNAADGFLRAHEIYNLRLPAELVVLSGCQTALGKEVRGEGLVGITRGFFYAGAARVMMSLWSIDDDATARLMVDVYTAMLKKGKRPAEALRAAQLAMWKSDSWQAPYYWAAFVLQGEWK